MKKKFIWVIAMTLCLFGCSAEENAGTNESLVLNEQTIEQLQLENYNSTNEEAESLPVNYENQKSIWFTMMDYEKALKYQSKEEFTDYISSLTEKIKNSGFNTIYVHVRPYNNAYYKSEIFPCAENYPAGYDSFEIIIEKAHESGLSVHGWINPLRCQNKEEMEKLDDKYQIKKWYNEKSDYISPVDGRYYLNPAYEEVREYISDGVTELVQNYSIDGIHIDDYFYPTKEESFDESVFEKSGENDLKEWRTENINLMVKGIYDTVKQQNEKLLFGISPQGNAEISINNLYADVKKWCSESGFCDYIAPQLYYGFKNESKPFEETLIEWKDMNTCDDVKLVAGICVYKIGNEDKWAGSGKNEWIEDKNIPSRQIECVFENNCSVAVYSVGHLFEEKNSEECKLISDKLNREES